MKKLILLGIALLCLQIQNIYSQESYGNTLNLGLGIGYYGYFNHSVPVVHINYEFDVAPSFTLAPFISFWSYRNNYYFKGNKNYPAGYFRYSETVIPVGVKGTYYFDELLNANSDWDFYLAGSLGAAIVRSRWADGYYGDRNIYRNSYGGAGHLFLDLHIGAQYQLSSKAGLYLDLSSGISTFGVALKM